MRTTLLTIFAFCSGLLFAQCPNCKKHKESCCASQTVGVNRTPQTENLLTSLKEMGVKGRIMFGHHDDTAYGIGWVGGASRTVDEGRSDVKSVCGDYPALLGFDLGRLELGGPKNLDGVEAERIRQDIIRHFERGGVATLSWHCYNPLSGRQSWVADSLLNVERQTVASILAEGETHDKFITWLDRQADFINSLQTADGVKVPVIFRPWHEHTGSWFWWGQNNCSTENFKALWRLTVNRFREQGVDNALFAYSTGTESGGDPAKFMERYPGDEYIDLIGLDFYCMSPVSEEAACARYFESAASHFYAPYPGHLSAKDFVKFRKDRRTLFLCDLKNVYGKAARRK